MDNRKFIGYLLLACKKLNYSNEQAIKLLEELSVLLQPKTSEQAEDGFEWLSNGQEKKADIKLNSNKVKPRKVTRLPDGFRSQLSKENEQLIKFLRDYNSPPWKLK